jgi:hypothetical protein
MTSVLVHLAAGVGNIVLATPLLVALEELGCTTEVWLSADYPGTRALLEDWSAVARIHETPPPEAERFKHVIPATPPFYWPRFASMVRKYKNCVARPDAALFYQDEQAFYMSFARALGYRAAASPTYRLPIGPTSCEEVSARTVILAPGCKTGEMAAKRWPWFPELSTRFEDVAVVGTSDDLRGFNGTPVYFPPHVRSLVDRLTLRRTAEVLASAGLVIGNDSGLAHIAAAVGTPTLMLFGPTPDRELGPLPPNAHVLRLELPCAPCWFRKRFEACSKQIDCLSDITVDQVVAAVQRIQSSQITGSQCGRGG